MPKRLNREPNGEWKAIVLSYDFIFSLSEQKCSYCLTEQQASALMQIAEYLSWQTRWDDAALGKDNDKLAAFAADIQRELMMSCCGGNPEGIERYNEDGILEISTDGGITWERAPDQGPRFNGPIMSPLPPIEGQDMKCISAANVLEWFRSEQQQTEDAMLAAAGVSGILAAMLSIVALMLGATGVGALLSPLLLGLAAALAGTSQAAFSAAMNEDVYDRLLCNIYCHCSDDGSVTETQWQEIKNQLVEEEGGIAFRFLYDNINAIGPAGVTNMMRSGTVAAADCTDCSCVPTCEDSNLWTFGTVLSVTPEPGGFILYELASEDNGGTQNVQWKDKGVPGCCCVEDWVIHDPNGSPGYWTSLCGADTYDFAINPAQNCVEGFAIYQNSITAPFTIGVRFKCECVDDCEECP